MFFFPSCILLEIPVAVSMMPNLFDMFSFTPLQKVDVFDETSDVLMFFPWFLWDKKPTHKM